MIVLRPSSSIFRRVLPVTALLTAAAVPAAERQDMAALKARLDIFVGAAGTARLDPRLSLAACAGEPQVEWYGALRRAVSVACAGQPGRRNYVPVAAPAASSTVPATFEPPVVKRGDPVRIVAGGAGFSISAEGVAEQDGRVGSRVRVRNARTGESLRAIVEGAGKVSMPGYKSGEDGR